MPDPGATLAARMPEPPAPLHILVLTDRDWTHPQAGGTGANLTGYLEHWLARGHRVTVLTSGYPGAERARARRPPHGAPPRPAPDARCRAWSGASGAGSCPTPTWRSRW